MRGAQRALRAGAATARCASARRGRRRRRRCWWSSAASLATRLGSEFIPSLDEGDIALHALRIPGTSLDAGRRDAARARAARSTQFPRSSDVFAKIGTAEIATDPMPPSVADTFVMLKPRDEWPDPRKPKARARRASSKRRLHACPGNNYEFTQPIQMRFNELIAGVRSDVAVKVFGDDLGRAGATSATRSRRCWRRCRAPPTCKVEQVDRACRCSTIEIDRDGDGALRAERRRRAGRGRGRRSAARRPARSSRATGASTSSCGCRKRCATTSTRSKRLPIPLPRSHARRRRALGAAHDAARVRAARRRRRRSTSRTGPNQISRENGKRRVVVTANVRGRDLGSFVAEAEQRIRDGRRASARLLDRPGAASSSSSSRRAQRLQIVVPLALLLIFAAAVHDLRLGRRDALLVFTGVPLALTGGVARALAARHAVLDLRRRRLHRAVRRRGAERPGDGHASSTSCASDGAALDDAVLDGALTRLRPVLMTALVASLGFVPMALATGTGAEVQRPLATVVDRRHPVVDAADAARAAGALPHDGAGGNARGHRVTRRTRVRVGVAAAVALIVFGAVATLWAHGVSNRDAAFVRGVTGAGASAVHVPRRQAHGHRLRPPAVPRRRDLLPLPTEGRRRCTSACSRSATA